MHAKRGHYNINSGGGRPNRVIGFSDAKPGSEDRPSLHTNIEKYVLAILIEIEIISPINS